MTNSTDIRDIIVAADENFIAAFNKGDAAGVAALYTENAQFMPPHGDFVKGRKAIQATFQSLMDSGIRSIKLAALEIEEYGDTATEIGTYALEGEGGQVLDQGKFLVIWKQEQGQWKLHRDMINSSLPMAK